jgi:transglutaminase-like putative cysteine protease
MSSTAQPAQGLLSTVVDRYLQVCLYLMLLTGFAALAATGQLDLPSVVLVATAFILRGYSLLRSSNTTLSDATVRWLALFYGAFYFFDLFFLSGHFLNATVHLVLFGMVLRLFSARRTRDHVFLALLAFAMVLAASVLTVAGTFLLAFAIFLLTATVTFILMEMSRGRTTAGIAVCVEDLAVAQRQLPWALAGTGATLVVVILAAAAAIFFVLPRASSGYLNSLQIGNDISTGFSNSVELGRIGEIQRSSAIVMHVKVEGDTAGNREMRLRGITLGSFDGRIWSNRLAQIVLPKSPDGNYVLARPAFGSGSAVFRYHVFAEPMGTNVFFLAERPLTFAGNYQLVAADSSAAVFALDRDHQVTAYDGTSLGAHPDPAQRSGLPATLPAPLAALYLELPALDPRIPQLARDVTAATTTGDERAAALEAYLSRTYAYTLELPAKEPKDPLANFLFERKQGHCEYFASSMAVMLRTLGIPSRLVNGFRGGEFNDVSGEYIVRAREAHSWVEAYISGRGWVSYDPTPATGLPAPRTGWSRLLFYADALSSFWREWIINYDAIHQRTLGEETLRNTRTMAQTWRQRIRAPYLHLLEFTRRTRDVAVQSPRRWMLGTFAAILLLLAAINLVRFRAWMERRRLSAHPEDAPREGASLWYVRLTHLLSRAGWKRAPTQTPKEFANSIQDAPLRAHVTRFTEHYEKARFGDSTQDAEQLPRLFEEIAESKR